MTREEEIQRKAGELADFGISHYQPNQQQYYEGFIDGAKWADQHPRKGLWNSEKIIEWLKENIDEYCIINISEDYFDLMYEDLKKAMEE